MSDSDFIPAVEALAANIVETQLKSLDTLTIELAKNRIIDVLGSVIGGANAPGNKELIELVRQSGGQKESTIMISGQKIPHNTPKEKHPLAARVGGNKPIVLVWLTLLSYYPNT